MTIDYLRRWTEFLANCQDRPLLGMPQTATGRVL